MLPVVKSRPRFSFVSYRKVREQTSKTYRGSRDLRTVRAKPNEGVPTDTFGVKRKERV